MKSVLFITRDSPLNTKAGGVVYALGILEYFAQKEWDVAIHWLNPVDRQHSYILPSRLPGSRIKLTAASCVRVGRWSLNFRKLLGIPLRLMIHLAIRMPGLGFMRSCLSCLAKKSIHWSHPTLNYSSDSPLQEDPTQAEVYALENLIEDRKPDLVLLNYIFLTPLITSIQWPKGCKRAVLAHDLWHLRAENLRAAGMDPDLKVWTFDEEAARYANADKVIGISFDERPVFERMLGPNKVLTVPKAVNWSEQASQHTAGRCLFVGTAMEVNVDGMRWLLDEVWPIVMAENPSASLHVCGSVCRNLPKGRHGVVLCGIVDNLQEEYDQTEVVVVPLRAGGGVKIKLVEALEHGKCCVSTTTGVRGLPLPEESGIPVCDSPMDFASAILRLIGNADERSAQLAQSKRWAAQRLSPEACHGPLLRWAGKTPIF